MKFKIRFSQLTATILLKQRRLSHIRHCLTEHNQIWHHFFINKDQSILMTFKTKIPQFHD